MNEMLATVQDDDGTIRGEIDGKPITYTRSDVFEVQVGRGKGAYSTRYKVAGNHVQAALLYRGINVGNGWKKRLLVEGAVLVGRKSE